MEKSEILKKATDELLEGVENFENAFSNLVKNPIPEFVAGTNYFTLKSQECVLLIAACDVALLTLPIVTPPTSKIQRIQYRLVKERLQKLVTDFNQLQLNLNILIPLVVPQRPLSSAESTTKNLNLNKILDSVPEIVNDLVFIKGICVTIREAFEF